MCSTSSKMRPSEVLEFVLRHHFCSHDYLHGYSKCVWTTKPDAMGRYVHRRLVCHYYSFGAFRTGRTCHKPGLRRRGYTTSYNENRIFCTYEYRRHVLRMGTKLVRGFTQKRKGSYLFGTSNVQRRISFQGPQRL
jgi:hypothetical protein